MLSKFKSKLFSARGVFGGGDTEEEATPTAKSDDSDPGVAGSHGPQSTASEKEESMKWYVTQNPSWKQFAVMVTMFSSIMCEWYISSI